MIVQSVIFSKEKWTLRAAKKWLVDHGYKTSFYGKPVDKTENYYRFRQAKPNPKKRYKIKSLPNNIKLVLMI